MQRDLKQLSETQFDVIVVGGGIYGAWTALDAAQRGLSVALVEQNDFCAATSFNNHRIIHGGLRYLQHGDLRRMRESIRERRILLRIAPELVRPMPVLMPTTSRWSQHRFIVGAALLANELISLGKNAGLDEMQRIPPSRLLSRQACEQLVPSLDVDGATGAAIFYDAQVLCPQRLALTILQLAAKEGAALANYVRATGYIRQGNRIAGIHARCMLTEETFPVQGRIVINCVGPWAAEQLKRISPKADHPTFKAAVLAARNPGLKSALAIPGARRYADNAEVLRKNYRNFFITPWRGLSLIGTFYAPHNGSAETCAASEQEIATWLDEINAAWPDAEITRDDIHHALTGLLPCGPGSTTAEPQYAKRFRLIDHGREDNIHGMLSVVGVKFTTARGVAEHAVDLAVKTLGRSAPPCRTARTHLKPDVTVAPDVRMAVAELHSNPAALRAAVLRAVRSEMACTLADVIHRRTDLASVGPPTEACLTQCAEIMAGELGWTVLERDNALQSIRRSCGMGGVVHAA